MKRRSFLGWGVVGSVAGASAWELSDRWSDADPYTRWDTWESQQVLHLLPTVDHQRIRLKVSFRHPLDKAPVLLAAPGQPARREEQKQSEGMQTDSEGTHWLFDLSGLMPATTYHLRLFDTKKQPLCAPWPLQTFPLPSSRPERFRLLSYTCAGGPNFFVDFRLDYAFLPIVVRQRLLARALAWKPDAIIANGDHVYWDMQSNKGWGMGNSPMARWRAGLFDRDLPILHTPNEAVLKKGFGPQIAALYRTMLRSYPTFFLQDDHDFMENDEPSQGRLLFPPDRFMREVAQLTQRIHYPELLDSPHHPASFNQPVHLPAHQPAHLPVHQSTPTPARQSENISRDHGTLRFGKLFEGLLYNCRSQMSTAQDGYFLPPDAERWVCDRLANAPTDHVVQIPSTPFLWTAGKWGEWYPDAIIAQGNIGMSQSKPFWSKGWNEQHNRLLGAAAQRKDRIPLTVSGDMHAVGIGHILKSGSLDLSHNPVISVLSGCLGTGNIGWPSQFRGVSARPSLTLKAHEFVPAREENGFCVLDFTPRDVTVSMFRWTPSMGVKAIDTLRPFYVFKRKRSQA